MKDLFIETNDGEAFYFDRSPFKVIVIASALSKLCRFGGHSTSFYSVAQHSILVADIMANLKLGDPFEGLMHDATEAYLCDIPSPWKVLLPDYKKWEGILEARLRTQFKLPAKITDGCKKADYLALFIEASFLTETKGKDWPAPDGLKEEAVIYMQTYPQTPATLLSTPLAMESAWLKEYLKLTEMF
jgi:hypothetical protein